MKTARARIARFFLALGLLATFTGCGESRPKVTIIVPWGGAEFIAFQNIVAGYGAAEVEVQSTRALDQHIDAAVNAGKPPDLAVLPNPGAINRYVKQYGNRGLKKITSDTHFLKPFGRTTEKAAGREPDVYAVPIKVDVKSLTWYADGDPAPGSDADWCLGLESGATTGWPGADWIADILLQKWGARTYREWVAGTSPWVRHQEVWTEWGELVRNSERSALVTNFGKATEHMAANNSSCQSAHGALAAMGFHSNLKNYRFATPSSNVPLQVSADYVGMFNTNDTTKGLIEYLTRVSTQDTWVNDDESSAFSPVAEVTPEDYRNSDVKRAIARLIAPDTRYTLCFSAADMMHPDLASAFYRAVLHYYVRLPKPGEEEKPLGATPRESPRETLEKTLSNTLRSLDEIQSTIPGPVPPENICTGPPLSP